MHRDHSIGERIGSGAPMPYTAWFVCAHEHEFAVVAREGTVNRQIQCPVCGTITITRTD